MTSKERRPGAPNLRGALAYVFPEGFILAAGVAYTHSRWLQNALGGFQDFFPYAMLGAGLLLGWRFQRSRLLFALLVLLIAHRVLTHLATGHGLGRDHVLYQAIGVLLPLNLAALSLTAERGFLTPPGLVRNGTILVQVLLVSWLDAAEPAATGALLHLRLMPQKLFAWTPLADPALLAFLVALALLIAGQLLAPNATGRSFIWATVAAFLGLTALRPGNPDGMTFYFATSALILIVAVIEASYYMAYQDSLTGLPARRALSEALLRLVGQYTVAMVDVDHFKKINDRHGHDVGDQVLKMIASRLAGVSGGGQAFRYGGEEFAVLFPGKTAEECVSDLEALRQTVEEAHFILRSKIRARRRPEKILAEKGPGRRVPVTVSIGVAAKNHRYTKADQVIRAADRALYRAKEGGRNQVQL